MRTIKNLTDVDRLALLEEYLSCDLSFFLFERKYSLSRGRIKAWLRIFGMEDKPKLITMPSKESPSKETLRKEVESLQLELNRMKFDLKQAQMARDAYNCMIDLAEEQFKIPIRKKSGAK
ncbi:MAG: hypothetical protein RR313_12065 [Anaerovoracaceae bacterium]